MYNQSKQRGKRDERGESKAREGEGKGYIIKVYRERKEDAGQVLKNGENKRERWN